MKKYLFILLLFTCLIIYGQPILKEKFITYSTVIKELEADEESFNVPF